MRVRDHVALSTAGAALLRPWLGRRAFEAWAASVLVDVDHYAWFALHERRISPIAAARFFNQADPPQHAAARSLHTPAALLAIAALAMRRRRLVAVASGIALHVTLDVQHKARMDQARAAALERDRFCCRACGAYAEPIETHLWRQPRLLPSYRPGNLVSLCGSCHEAAHASEIGPDTWK